MSSEYSPKDMPNMLEFFRHELSMTIIARRQLEVSAMFSRLREITDQLYEKCESSTNTTKTSLKLPAFVSDHNYARFNETLETTSLFPSPIPVGLLSSAEGSSELNKYLTTHKIIDKDDASLKQDEEQEEKYPKKIGDNIVLGPNGTLVELRSYSNITWSSAGAVTRQLLGFVFGSDILATHTLTGKPSPAFHGRERPPKLKLDPIKVADIIHCVRCKFNCTHREVRAAITTKCSDTSKKYKRLKQKQLESKK